MSRFRFWRPDPAADVDEELRFHLEMRTREYVAGGLTEPDARRLAERRFGSVDRARRDTLSIDTRVARREGRRELFAALRHDVLFALRVLRRQWAPALAAAACVAVGIGATTTMFSVADALLVRALPYPAGDRLMIVGVARRGERQGGVVSYLDYLDFRRQQRAFTTLAAWGPIDFSVRGTGGAAERVTGALVSANLLAALGASPEAGRTFTAEEDAPGGPPAVLVSHGFAEREFGSARRALHATFAVNGETREVVGVVPDRWRYPSRAELYVPLGRDPLDGRDERGHRNLTVLGALRPGLTLDAARQDMAAVAETQVRTYPRIDSELTAVVTPMRDTVVGDAGGPLTALSTAAALVLLVACANVATLQLARSAARSSEIAVRAALGAGRARIVRQLLTESVVLSLAGGVLGVALAYWSRGLVARAVIARTPAWMTFDVDRRALAFSLLAATLTGLAFGLAPALRLASVRPALGQRGGALGVARGGLQRALVTAELTLALVLGAGALLALESIRSVQRVPLGFAPAGVLTARISTQGGRLDDPRARARLVDEIETRIRALPNVAEVGAVSRTPLNGCCAHFGVKVEGHDADSGKLPVVSGAVATPGYLRAMGIALVAGRGLEARDDADAPPVVVVSEEFARRYWPGESALGRHVDAGDGDATIVGVVRDVKQASPVDAPEPQFYRAYAADPWTAVTFTVRARAGDPTALAPAVTRAVHDIAPDVPVFDVRTMSDVVAEATASARVFAELLGAFAAVALLLAATGVYALLSFFVAQRTRELGLRVALGAVQSQVVRLVLRQSAALASVGVALGLAGALVASRWLAHLLYGVAPLQPLALLAAGAACVAVSVAATWGPARRASAADPMEVLRSD